MAKKYFLVLFSITIALTSFLSCTKDVGQLPVTVKKEVDCNTIKFTKDIKPLIDQHCVGCHSSNFSGGDLVTYADIKLKVDNGSLLQQVVIDKTMPDGLPLTAEEIQKFKCWIEKGGHND